MVLTVVPRAASNIVVNYTKLNYLWRQQQTSSWSLHAPAGAVIINREPSVL